MPMYSAGGPMQGGGGVGGIRNAITQALMNVQNPQPRTEMPGAQPGMPGMGAPPGPQGIPPGAPPGMPGAGGMPPPGGGGMPGGAMPPGGVMPPPAAMAQQGGQPPPMPGGAPIGPPPRVPNMVGQQPIDPMVGTQMPGGPGQLGPY